MPREVLCVVLMELEEAEDEGENGGGERDMAACFARENGCCADRMGIRRRGWENGGLWW